MTKHDKYVYIGYPNKHTDNTPWFGTVGQIITNDNDISFIINKSNTYCVTSDDILYLDDFLHKANTLLRHKTIFIAGGDELQKNFVFDYLRIEDYYDICGMCEHIVVGMQNDCCQVEISTHCGDYAVYVVVHESNKNITMMTIQEYLYWNLKDIK